VHHRAGVMRTSAEGLLGGRNGVRARPTQHNLGGSIIVPEANLPRRSSALFPSRRYQASDDCSRHGPASTDNLLKNQGHRGSRHNGGHTPLSPLISLLFFGQNIPCAMVLQLIAASPRRPRFDCLRPPGLDPEVDPSIGRSGPHAFAVRKESLRPRVTALSTLASTAPRFLRP